MIEKNFYRVLNILLWIVIAASAAHVLTAYFVERSLWIDEAMLMKSVITRDFSGILQGFFDDNQSAPPCYMLAVKALTLVFGTSPMALRLYSLLLYFGSAALIYSIARSTMKFRLPLLPVAVIMALTTVQHYATEAKPYMNDVFFSLFAIWLYSRFVRGKMSFVAVAVAMGISVWFSFGALFTMGGICAWHFIIYTRRLCLGKEKTRAWFVQVLPLLIVALSAALYYFLWALPASTNVPDPKFDNSWSFLNFPLIPKNAEDIRLIKLMFLNFMEGIPVYAWAPFVVGLAYFLIARIKNFWLSPAMLLSALMIMVISSLGMYPIANRLVLSQVVICWLSALWSMDLFMRKIAKNPCTIAIISLLILLPLGLTVQSTFNFAQSDFYKRGQEFAKCQAWLAEHRAPGSMLYIMPLARPAAQYYLDYPDKRDLQQTSILRQGDLIWGTPFRQLHNEEPYVYKFNVLPEEVGKNMRAIMSFEDVYIINVHEVKVSRALTDSIKAVGGDIDLVYDFMGAEVYRYRSGNNKKM